MLKSARKSFPSLSLSSRGVDSLLLGFFGVPGISRATFSIEQLPNNIIGRQKHQFMKIKFGIGFAQSDKLKQYFCLFELQTMLLRRVSNVNGFELQAITLQVDPHGRLLCLFNPDRLEFVLLEIPQIYMHFLEYRINYFKHYCYDNSTPVPCPLTFKSEQILQSLPAIKFSVANNGQQWIVIRYSTFLELIKISNSQFVIRFRTLFKFKSEILQATVIGEQVYALLYDSTLLNISLNLLQTCKKSQACKQISILPKNASKKQVCMKESLRLDENPDHSDRLWQNFAGCLMHDSQIISREFQENLDPDNSLQEFIFQQEKGQTNHPVKYYMSNCMQYLIGSRSGKISTINENFKIYSRTPFWAQICTLNVRPEINQFWTAFKQRVGNLENWGFKYSAKLKEDGTPTKIALNLSDKLLIAYYQSIQNIVTISWILVKKHQRKRQITSQQNNGEIRYKFKQKIILQVKKFKCPIASLHWIGLNQLLLIDKSSKLHFLQFSQQELNS